MASPVIMRTRFRFQSRMRFVLARIYRKQQNVLRRVGARVRGVMIHSIQSGRHRKSVPGLPPRYKRGKAGGLRWVLFDVDMGKQSVIIGPGRTRPKQSYVRGKQVITIREKWPVPRTLNDAGTASFTVLYLTNGYESTKTIQYRRFPIRDYPPTIAKSNDIFLDTVASVKL